MFIEKNGPKNMISYLKEDNFSCYKSYWNLCRKSLVSLIADLTMLKSIVQMIRTSMLEKKLDVTKNFEQRYFNFKRRKNNGC